MPTDACVEGELRVQALQLSEVPEAHAPEAGRSPAVWTDACVEGELRVQTLHLFSGPDDREDGIAAFLHVDGIGMDCIDLINEHTVDRDISDDAVLTTWQQIWRSRIDVWRIQL